MTAHLEDVACPSSSIADTLKDDNLSCLQHCSCCHGWQPQEDSSSHLLNDSHCRVDDDSLYHLQHYSLDSATQQESLLQKFACRQNKNVMPFSSCFIVCHFKEIFLLIISLRIFQYFYSILEEESNADSLKYFMPQKAVVFFVFKKILWNICIFVHTFRLVLFRF